jgi:hypothetical protein
MDGWFEIIQKDLFIQNLKFAWSGQPAYTHFIFLKKAYTYITVQLDLHGSADRISTLICFLLVECLLK